MKQRSPLLLGAATLVLWFVPSVGTQGMGTIGQRVAHPDAVLFDTLAIDRSAARVMLAQADRIAELAVAR